MVDIKPKLYYRVVDDVPFDGFCSDAAIGAVESGIEAISFETLPNYDPYNIVVSSVEETQLYLGKNVKTIDRSWSTIFEGREIKEGTIDELTKFPCFIKPSEEVKAWTGVCVDNMREAKLFTNDYKGKILGSDIINIETEYRVYITKLRGVLGVKHYLGDPYIPLDRGFVEACVKSGLNHLSENSFTLDFGVDTNGKTFLIEVNDGWSIGNYGLNPKDYYSFVKSRFLQLTNVLT